MTYDSMTYNILERAKRYRDRATRYLQNYEWELEKKDREKAGEALWGVLSCIINAISILENGKPKITHKDLTEFAREIILGKLEEEDAKALVVVFSKAERFHANFYHAFLPDDEFKDLAAKIIALIERLDRVLVDELERSAAKITSD